MKCKKIQEFIITDFIDGQMEAKQTWLIEEHLADCPACNGYLSNVKNEAVNPFAYSIKEVPINLLWVQIKQTIDEENQQHLEESLKPNFWDKFKSVVYIPRPAFALATLVTMIYMFGSTGQLFLSAPVANINGQDQVAYLSSLIDDPVVVDNANDSQTPIEKVFL